MATGGDAGGSRRLGDLGELDLARDDPSTGQGPVGVGVGGGRTAAAGGEGWTAPSVVFARGGVPGRRGSARCLLGASFAEPPAGVAPRVSGRRPAAAHEGLDELDGTSTVHGAAGLRRSVGVPVGTDLLGTGPRRDRKAVAGEIPGPGGRFIATTGAYGSGRSGENDARSRATQLGGRGGQHRLVVGAGRGQVPERRGVAVSGPAFATTREPPHS